MERLNSGETLYVAVGKVVEESKLTLLWALQNLQPEKVCLLHVHQPARTIPTVNEGFSASKHQKREIQAAQEGGKQILQRIMNEYILICLQAQPGVHAEHLYIENNHVARGIVEAIQERYAKNLVMGAAADKHYSQGMTVLRSEKSLYVDQCVPPFCKIWFICGGDLVHTRSTQAAQSDSRNPPSSRHLACSSEEIGNLNQSVLEEILESQSELEYSMQLEFEEDLGYSEVTDGESSVEKLYNQLKETLLEAEKLKKESMRESLRHSEVRRRAIMGSRQVESLEKLYKEELRRRKECEALLAEQKQKLQNIKQQRDEEHLISQDQKLLLENQLASSDYIIKGVKEQLRVCTDERDNLSVALEDAQKFTEELLKRQEETSNVHMKQFFCELSVSEIQEATEDFDPSWKIGEGAYGIIYKGFLRCTTVAIKVFHPNSLQGPSEFQKEVDVLSTLRHPNLVTLIGACPEIWALVYEYVPNGNLEDRLSCRNDTPPLPWQTRIHIATDLCTVLIFLHSSKPQSVVHGNLKPGNILLDASFMCKLSDLGVHQGFSLRSPSSNNDLNSGSPFLDPELCNSGRLSPSSDIYSFGIILLQLLTGRSAAGIAEIVQDALNGGYLNNLLDPSAGAWPYVQAAQLSRLALRCCAPNRSRRPDLASEVLNVLVPIRDSCAASPSLHAGFEENSEPPSYFICPILQEVMTDPQVAADGFTYELEALQEWLDSGHNTSPMTNVRLANCNLVPNHALRSAILEWQQQH